MHLILSDVNRVTKVVDKGRKLPDLLLIGIIVRPVNERKLLPEIVLRHRLICDQHEILNNLCRYIPLIRHDCDRLAALIQNDFRLREIKVDRAALHPFFPKNCGKLAHPLEHRDKLFILFDLGFVLILQNLLHAGIAHAAVDIDDGLGNHMVNDVSLRIDRHDTAQRKPILSRIQGADTVRELMRQHRYHTIHQIDRCAAL